MGGRAPPEQNTQMPSSGSQWLAQFTVLTLQGFEAALIFAAQTIARSGIVFRLLAPGPQAVRRAAQLGRNGPVSRIIAWIIRTVLFEKPDAACAKFSRVSRGGFSLCHRTPPWRVLLSGKTRAVQFLDHRNNLRLPETALSHSSVPL